MGKTAHKRASRTRKQSGSEPKKSAGKKSARWGGLPSQKDDRREAILRSVANVLRSSRVSSLTIKQVADELGMTKGNLYYYFKDKQDILYHCHMRSVENSLRALSDAHALGRTPSEKLRILLVRHIRGTIDDGFGGILQTDLENMRSPQRRQYIAKRDELERGVRSLIEEGVRTGEFVCGDVKLAGFAILGGINWIPKWYRPSGPFSSAQISESMTDYYLRGLRSGANAEGRAPLLSSSNGSNSLVSNIETAQRPS
jgi:AcrR family transcriptional regulator